MAIAYDANTPFDFTTTNSTTHTPSGTPKGIVVLIVQSTTSDEVSALTYGGVAMAKIIAASTPAAVAWFLGSSVPTGAQTVAFTCTAGAAKRAVIVSLTATGDTGVEDSDQLTSAGTATPSITLATSVETWIGGCLHSGNDDPATLNSGASYTVISERDFGTNTGSLQRITSNAAAGSPVCDWTQSSDFARCVAIAVRDEGAGGPAAAVLDPYGMRGFFGA